eukprot:TRINITY_DN4667_c0_g1_i1.p1 TRINITY_DN4667_c0_g1~~TRINITY_DN4667_c0_g1_i1.p1  ORF type:complete len:222 (+),score=52.56 TRINITY_DN4667_c0_g1_i1:84-668(+)
MESPIDYEESLLSQEEQRENEETAKSDNPKGTLQRKPLLITMGMLGASVVLTLVIMVMVVWSAIGKEKTGLDGDQDTVRFGFFAVAFGVLSCLVSFADCGLGAWLLFRKLLDNIKLVIAFVGGIGGAVLLWLLTLVVMVLDIKDYNDDTQTVNSTIRMDVTAVLVGISVLMWVANGAVFGFFYFQFKRSTYETE